MFFQNAVHENNFRNLIRDVFPHANDDVEYKVMCYIQSLPSIYERYREDPLFREFPFLWTVKYIDKSYEDEDGLVISFDYVEDQDGNTKPSEDFSTLSSGYQKIVHLGENLFNSSNDSFNLCESLSTWDEEMIKIYMQAVMIRLEKRKIFGMGNSSI